MEGDRNLRAQGKGLETTPLLIYSPNDSWNLRHARYRGHREKPGPSEADLLVGGQIKWPDKARAVMTSGVRVV